MSEPPRSPCTEGSTFKLCPRLSVKRGVLGLGVISPAAAEGGLMAAEGLRLCGPAK